MAIQHMALAWVVATAFVAGPARAGFEIVTESREADRRAVDAHRGRIVVEGLRARFEDAPLASSQATSAPQSWGTVIYHGERGLLWSLDVGRKSYVEIDRRTVATLGVALRAARREVSGRVGSLPDSQRATAKQWLEMTAQVASEDPKRPPVRAVRGEGESQEAGRACRLFALHRGEAVVGEACVAAWDDVPVTRPELEVFRQLANFLRDVIGAVGTTPPELVPLHSLELLDQLDGLPLRIRWLADGKLESELRIVSIEPATPSESALAPPAGYRRVSGLPAALP